MAQSELLIWNPLVHERFQESLVFCLLKLKLYEKQTLLQELQGLFAQRRFGGYRIYEVYGAFDFLLRLWLPKGEEAQVAAELEEKVSHVEKAVPFVVWRIPHHWIWGQQAVSHRLLDRLMPENIRVVQNHFSEESYKEQLGPLLESGLARVVFRPTADDGQAVNLIKFFSFVTYNRASAAIDKRLLEQLTDKLKEFESKGQLDRPSVYLVTGSASLVIKAETKDFFAVSDFIVSLNQRLADYGGVTMTQIVAERNPILRDDIGEDTFQRVQHKDLRVAAILPELYVNRPSPELLSEIESWIHSNVLPVEFRDEQIAVIHECLKGVLAHHEEAFATAMAIQFGRTERFLRENQGKFVGKVVGPDNYGKVLDLALRNTGLSDQKRNEKLLSLGDRLSIFVRALHMAGHDTADADLENWTAIVALRNVIAHNAEDLLPNWQEHLSTFSDFLRRVSRLVDKVKEVNRARG